MLGWCDVEWIIVTWGRDQLQCWWTQKEPSGSLKSWTFLDSLSSCWLCKKGCAACWVKWEGAGVAEWDKWLSCGQNDRGFMLWFFGRGMTFFFSPEHPHQLSLAHLAFCSVGTSVKWLGHEANHSYLSSARVKNVWSYTSTTHCTLILWCLIKHKDSCLYMKRFHVTGLCYLAQTSESGRQWIVM